MSQEKQAASTYVEAGVDYEALDAGKRLALAEALATSGQLARHGGEAVDASRGEPAFVFRAGGQTLAFVLEGLGTKSIIARLVEGDCQTNPFHNVAYDTVAAIVNDLCCVGAAPLVVNAYFATGSSEWYGSAERQEALLSGWRRACEDAHATWGGGESPSLPELVYSEDIELAGSAVGLVPPGIEPVLGQDLEDGDEIVLVASTGLHANGSSLARLVADRLDDGYATRLPSGARFGEALLAHAPIYSTLVSRLIERRIPLHYLSHITGHGLLKLMRPARAFTYVIDALPPVPEVLDFMVEQADLSPSTAYSTFNMGCGFAIYCARGSGGEIVDIAGAAGYAAHVAGRVCAGPRRVVLEPVDVTFEDSDMDLTPRRAGP